jgi:hypothetical protein
MQHSQIRVHRVIRGPKRAPWAQSFYRANLAVEAASDSAGSKRA